MSTPAGCSTFPSASAGSHGGLPWKKWWLMVDDVDDDDDDADDHDDDRDHVAFSWLPARSNVGFSAKMFITFYNCFFVIVPIYIYYNFYIQHHIHIYTYIHIYIYTYIHIYIYTYIHIYIYTYIHIYIYTYIYYVYMYLYLHRYWQGINHHDHS